jgi:UDP-N-acetylmuramyl pentapeptide phosphotransferase/UDP-N-acetylglucosamine-1-phosphate transferase
MLYIFTSFLASLLITFFATPMVLRVAHIRKIFDEPDERKIHKKYIPSLGGVAIFSGVFFSIMFWTEANFFEHLRWIILPLVIIFLLGLKDDIVSINPYKKLGGQIIAALLIVIWGDIKIDNLHGLIGIHQIPSIVAILLTVFTIIVIMNSFNLIDGIDGLAGGIGVIASLTFGTLFLLSNHTSLALIAFSLTGSLLAFLKFNFSPAKIFMGDSGSLVVGFMLSILSIELLNTNLNNINPDFVITAPPLILSILIIPLGDTLRVFIIRIRQKKSPFHADRNHIHHLLLKMGLDHRWASSTLYFVNILFIVLTFIFSNVGMNFLMFLIIISAIITSQLPYLILTSRKKAEEKENTVLHTAKFN